MKVSALLLAKLLLLATSAEARLFDKTREINSARETEQDNDRIINGVEAEEDRYSYMVSLKDNQVRCIPLLLSLNAFTYKHTSYSHLMNHLYKIGSLLWSFSYCY